MKILVSGAREGFDQKTVEVTLGRLLHQFGEKLIIIEGCATGVDTQAWEWARDNKVACLHYPAPWSHMGKPAGPWRNWAMLNLLLPDRVVAFHHTFEKSRGTKNMVEIAQKAGLPTHVIQKPL